SVLPDLPDAINGEPFDAVVATFDSLNYLTEDDFRRTLTAVESRLRPGGWVVFDLHTDAMMRFTAGTPVVSGEDDGHRFVIRSDVKAESRTCVTEVEVTRLSNGETFAERHQQFFHCDTAVRNAITAAGLVWVSATREYTTVPVDSETLRATWTARRPPASEAVQ
ncbi:MAG: hypothetical protein WBG57_03070, partial [Ornithinimicrobium sp.]